MNLKHEKYLLLEAMNSGCKTAAHLAQFLKTKSMKKREAVVYIRTLKQTRVH